ncbi:putative serine/threonine-protein phosphatase with EF-hands [Plasmopara halstedii]
MVTCCNIAMDFVDDTNGNKEIVSAIASRICRLFSLFLFFTLVLILQNLYASTMVDTYVLMSARADEKEEILGFQVEHLQHFQKIWSEFDTDALGLLHKKHLFALLNRLEPPLGLGTFQAMLESMATDEMTPENWTAVSNAVHSRRREMYHDIEARIAELTYRVRLGLGSFDGLNGNVNTNINFDLICPPNMFRFTDLLLVLTMRVLPLESLTVQEKVDELAMRGYAFRHRKAIMIQSSYKMFRTRRRIGSR